MANLTLDGNPILTSDGYAAKGGVVCPNCLSKDVEGMDVEMDIGIAWQNCRCGQCHAEWVDTYTLTGYSNLEAEGAQ